MICSLSLLFPRHVAQILLQIRFFDAFFNQLRSNHCFGVPSDDGGVDWLPPSFAGSVVDVPA